jgi:hypothetical protein
MTVIRLKIYTCFHALAKYYTNFMAVMGITCISGLGICKKAKQLSVCLQLQLFALLEITEVHEFAIFRF